MHSRLYSLSTHHASDTLHYDLVVVGGGIVGLATAREVATRYPDMKIALVEKERDVGKDTASVGHLVAI